MGPRSSASGGHGRLWAAGCVAGALLRVAVWAGSGEPRGIEVHQPATSGQQLLEAAALQAHGLSPYAAHTATQLPLTYALFLAPTVAFPGLTSPALLRVWMQVALVVADILTALGVAGAAAACRRPASSSAGVAPAVALLHLANPLNVLSCAALSLAVC
eukprot:EG_transcript_38332